MFHYEGVIPATPVELRTYTLNKQEGLVTAMTHDVTPPLSCRNVLPLNAEGFLRVTVTYQAVSLGIDPSENREAAEHLLETVTEDVKDILDGLNEVIDTIASIEEASDGVHTKYGDLRGLDTDAAEATVKIGIYVPGFKIPVEELIFRVNEALYSALLCMWHVIDPEGYEAAAGEETDEKTWEPLDLEGTIYGLN